MNTETKNLVCGMEFKEFSYRLLSNPEFAALVERDESNRDFGYERYLEITGKPYSIEESQNVAYGDAKHSEIQLSLV